MLAFATVLASYLFSTAALGLAFAQLWRLGYHSGLDDILAACAAFVGIGCLGYLGFYVYFFSITVGTVYSTLILALLIASLGIRELRTPLPVDVRAALLLTGLYGLACLGALYIWAPFADAALPWLPARLFFENQRPHDQMIPLMFAEAIGRDLAITVWRRGALVDVIARPTELTAAAP